MARASELGLMSRWVSVTLSPLELMWVPGSAMEFEKEWGSRSAKGSMSPSTSA